MRLNRNLILGIVIVAIILAIFIIQRPKNSNDGSLGLVNSQQDFIEASVGDIAPDFRLESLNGKIVSLSEFRGKPVMVNFWATWCPFCIAEMPDMQQVYDESKKDGLVILAVNRAESLEKIDGFLANELEGMIRYTILLDRQDDVARAYIQLGMPVSYFIDRNGRIIDRKFGQLSLAEIREKVGRIT